MVDAQQPVEKSNMLFYTPQLLIAHKQEHRHKARPSRGYLCPPSSNVLFFLLTPCLIPPPVPALSFCNQK